MRQQCWNLLIVVVLGFAPHVWAQTGSPREQKTQKTTKPWIAVGQLDRAIIKEASGVVKSRKHKGVFWTHSDSGNSPKLIAFRLDGTIVGEFMAMDAPNTDWEDIAFDQEGNLWVGDIGNNYKLFPARYLYVFSEPDTLSGEPGKIRRKHRWKYKFPGKDKRFNAESLYIREGVAHLITIGLSDGRPQIMRMQRKSEKELVPKPIHTFHFYQARGADLSEDGRTLVISAPESLMLVPLDKDGLPDKNQKKQVVHVPRSHAEGCCFDGNDVIMVNEAGKIYRIPREDFEAGVRYVRPAKKKTGEK